jgi:hypothetical protein
MTLANVQGKLNRAEMRKVMAGVDNNSHCYGAETPCSYYESGTGMVTGKCGLNSLDRCVCIGPNSSIEFLGCSSTNGGGQ